MERILFIGDCMWEQDQLFPEIRKVCELDVLDLRPALQTCADSRAAVAQAISDYVASALTSEPDLIFFYARPAILSEEAFSIIRSRWSCPLIGMNLDDRVEFFPYGILKSGNDGYARWIRSFDLNLTSSVTAMDWYRERGANVRYFPQGFRPDPKYLLPPDRAEFGIPFSFVGSWKPERGQVMDELASHGIRPALFGKGWRESRWIDDPGTVFRGSQINLGIGYALASARIANAKGRDIECPGTGACYLTTYHWELAEMFEIGKEVLCYRNMEELVELVSFYSKRPDACLKIAQAAHRRAHAEHTWEKRLRILFQDLGFQPKKT
ncbi:MAG: glycosyltransferase [Luteolibacter sp.]